jgi:hypothetical protein
LVNHKIVISTTPAAAAAPTATTLTTSATAAALIDTGEVFTGKILLIDIIELTQ